MHHYNYVDDCEWCKKMKPLKEKRDKLFAKVFTEYAKKRRRPHET